MLTKKQLNRNRRQITKTKQKLKMIKWSVKKITQNQGKGISKNLAIVAAPISGMHVIPTKENNGDNWRRQSKKLHSSNHCSWFRYIKTKQNQSNNQFQKLSNLSSKNQTVIATATISKRRKQHINFTTIIYWSIWTTGRWKNISNIS